MIHQAAQRSRFFYGSTEKDKPLCRKVLLQSGLIISCWI